jgi:antitoxin component of MazEF toxin-antitoxin module
VDLAQLLAGITPENQHGEIVFGDPVGKEPL